jgi:hypothetical protein
MTIQVTPTYSGTGVNTGDILVSIVDTPTSTNQGIQRWTTDNVVGFVQWNVAVTAGTAVAEITYDGVTWITGVAFQDLTGTAATTYVTSMPATKAYAFYNSVRGIRFKQSGATATTIAVFGWGYGAYG